MKCKHCGRGGRFKSYWYADDTVTVCPQCFELDQLDEQLRDGRLTGPQVIARRSELLAAIREKGGNR